MDREHLVFAALTPMDLALGATVRGLRVTGQLGRVTDAFYNGIGIPLRAMFSRMNDLQVEGAEKVPQEGGVLFASNHQSWSDVQVLGVSCPRRLRFLAKAEFEKWPILRHMIVLSDSPFIRRGGDRKGMELAINFLRDGKALCIFPEGTIPGEENLARHQVEPDTGLLRGHTGAVRLAIAAKVPLVPVGVSGTGASLPPEVYPRLELLEAPKPVPITVRYGEPISLEEYYDREPTHEELRTLTHRLMLAISRLVDHERNYVPIKVPIPELPKYEKIGVLLLHGFTSSVKTVDGLVPLLEEAKIPYRVPVLRGHGTVYTDLIGVKAEEWVEDAQAALLDLAEEVDRVVVVGLSMGGMVTIELGIRHPDKIAGIVTLAAALKLKDPLTPLTPAFARIVKSWPAPNSFNEPSLKIHSQNYTRFPTAALLELLQFSRAVESRLSECRVPICVLQSKKDQIVTPVAANLIYHGVSSEWREIHWFEKSGHEMGQDLEKDLVFEKVMAFVGRFRKPEEPLPVAEPPAAVQPVSGTPEPMEAVGPTPKEPKARKPRAPRKSAAKGSKTEA